MSYERTWKENQIVKTYKWANGFTKTKMNKLQTILGNGCYWGMAYIICGWGAYHSSSTCNIFEFCFT
jgi:hypothetical protein